MDQNFKSHLGFSYKVPVSLDFLRRDEYAFVGCNYLLLMVETVSSYVTQNHKQQIFMCKPTFDRHVLVKTNNFHFYLNYLFIISYSFIFNNLFDFLSIIIFIKLIFFFLIF